MDFEGFTNSQMYYILDGRDPIAVTFMEWATWYETADRVVKKTVIGDHEISTVFLGLDHAWRSRLPLLFETMVFSHDEMDGTMIRCTTYDEAERQHERVVGEVMMKYSFQFLNEDNQ